MWVRNGGWRPDGEQLCTFYAKEPLTGGGCSFMDTTDIVTAPTQIDSGGSARKGEIRMEGAEARVRRKRPDEEGRGGHGERNREGDGRPR